MTITVRPLTPTIGAEISGVDLTRELDPRTIAEIRQALMVHLVIFFRDQPLSPDDHVRFARCFGEISIPAFRPKASLSPEVVVLDQVNPRGEGADRWHTDNTYMAEPPMGSVLRSVQIPSSGGDTCFASMYAAYDALSPRLQAMLDGMNAVHDIVPLLQKSMERGLIEADLDEMRES
jgi:taurine dioxygenase